MLFRAPRLDALEKEVAARVVELRERLRHEASPHRAWYRLLERNSKARAIRASNSIEGYDVSVDDAIAGVESEEPLEADESAYLAFLGNYEAMAYVLRLADDPHFRFSIGTIRSLHFMMLKHELDKNPGTWRPGWIGVRNSESGELVYDAPDVDLVPDLMDELVADLNRDNSRELPMVTAAMAHLNLVMIHPFSDGNGRMARCLQTLVLGRAAGVITPTFASIEEYLARNRQEYYGVLADVGQGSWNPQNDTRSWIRYCLKAHYYQAMTWLRRARQLSRLWDELERVVAERGLMPRMMLALSDAAHGLRVRNATYRPVAEISISSATKDLLKLVDEGLLEPRGEKRGRYYVAGNEIKAAFERSRLPKEITDPFVRETPTPTLPGIGGA